MTIWYYCDSCSQARSRQEVRYQCNDCPDFDYCSTCINDAPILHPGHSFNKLEPLSPSPDTHPDETEGPEPEKQELVWEPKCASCVSVTKVLPILFLVLHDEDYPGAKPENLEVGWPLRLSHLIQATQRGCGFCCFVLHTFFRENNFETHSYEEDTPWYAEPLKHDDERKKLVEHCMGTLTRLKNDHFQFSVTPKTSTKGLGLPDFDKILIALSPRTTKFNSMAELKEAGVFHSAGVISAERYVCAAEGDPASKYISSRPPRASPASDEGIEQVRKWIRDCNERHGNACRPSTQGRLPSRVIDVSGGETLTLCETDGSVSSDLKYAALSYCWGGHQEFQTATESLSNRRGGFSVTDLPQTIQDAVKITQEIGIQYIWVDSLCIIQDDPNDKVKEVAQMADVYKNAYITISAARARKATDGFLRDWSNPETKLWKPLVPLAFDIPDLSGTTLPSLKDAMKLPRPHKGILWIYNESSGIAATTNDPVNERAWCLQEQALSPRLLSYGTWPTWRCNRLFTSDGGYSRDRDQDRTASNQIFTNAMINLTGTPDIFRTSQLLHTWRDFVENYSRRQMSVKADKLPAIAGIAREMSRVTGLEYAAGLWKENMLQDLMWRTANGKDWLLRSVEWRAPTWSWASVDAPVLYDEITPDATPLATVIECKVTPAAGTMGFEAVTAGKVVIKGPFKEVDKKEVMKVLRQRNFSPAPPMSNNVQEWYKQMLEHQALMPDSSLRVDIEEVEAKLPNKVFGLIMFSRGWSQDRWDKERPKEIGTCWFGLFLAEIDEGRYGRVGSFWDEKSAFLDQEVNPWEEKVVTLV
ncbi:heterokaryon incompatibility protein 6 [Podospora fimiseda]|uniref:Heterokaryon incompatibility protein 6 n=1 Tax=Podospora fimiseda TaxID=252190 RepID=A0AAN7H5S4_9PEZI|nr:heterokaryon incompatibility protein 6 [Podospora fimiseda]